jgi:hypothetical protein
MHRAMCRLDIVHDNIKDKRRFRDDSALRLS